jgi:hypothetical protein
VFFNRGINTSTKVRQLDCNRARIHVPVRFSEDDVLATLFFSYSHKDEELRNALEVHLSMLKRQGLIEAFHDRRIVAGEPLDESIDAYLEAADIILCLVSPDFIDSEYCYSHEMSRALERNEAGEAKIIPVILRHCEWQQTPLKGLRGTPRDNKPVKAWPDIDEALNDVARDIRRAIESRTGTRHAPQVTTSTLSSTESSPVKPRARSANLHIPKTLTDRDRDEYVETSFEFLAEFFANSLAELQARHPQLSGKLTRLDARRFTAVAYREGRKISAVTVYMGSSWGHGRGISFNNDDRGEIRSSNGSFDLPDRSDELQFRSIFSQFSGEKEFMNHEEVAESIWAFFIEPLQR